MICQLQAVTTIASPAQPRYIHDFASQLLNESAAAFSENTAVAFFFVWHDSSFIIATLVRPESPHWNVKT